MERYNHHHRYEVVLRLETAPERLAEALWELFAQLETLVAERWPLIPRSASVPVAPEATSPADRESGFRAAVERFPALLRREAEQPAGDGAAITWTTSPPLGRIELVPEPGVRMVLTLGLSAIPGYGFLTAEIRAHLEKAERPRGFLAELLVSGILGWRSRPALFEAARQVFDRFQSQYPGRFVYEAPHSARPESTPVDLSRSGG